MNCEMVVQTVKGVVPVTRFGATVDALVSEHPRDAQKSVALLILFEFTILVVYFFFFSLKSFFFFFQIRVYLNRGIFFC